MRKNVVFLQQRVNQGVNYPPQQESQHILSSILFLFHLLAVFQVLDWCQRRSRVNIVLTDGGEALNHFIHITLTTEGTAFHRSTGEAAENRKKKKEVSKEKRDLYT